MTTESIHPLRRISMILGLVTLADVVLLLVLDAEPKLFPRASHPAIAAWALAMIAVAYLMSRWAKRPGRVEALKATLLAAAFLFWAANQYWSNLPEAGLFNDIAIGLFVLDVFFVISGWPESAREDDSFAAPSGS